jgi:hypothetical protein
LSFWYEHNGIRYYCHDNAGEIKGEMVPPSGYWFKGVVSEFVKDFVMVEWPGINQQYKIRVPIYSGMVLDSMYPMWAFRKQRYEIRKNNVEMDKTASYHEGGATSPFRVHVKSMSEFINGAGIKSQLVESEKVWNKQFKDY